MTEVVKLHAPRHDLAVLVENIQKALESKPGQPIHFVEALGALELVKLQLHQQMLNGDGT